MAKNKTKPDPVPPLNPLTFVHQPHDKYVRFALQIKGLAIEFLQYSLDERFISIIDWESLNISKDSFVDEKLKAHFSDICYSGFTKGGKPFRIATLIEHKSEAPDIGELTLQLGRYIFNSWQDDLKHKRPLTLMVPIVLFHGSARLIQETTQILFPEAPDWLYPFVPSFDYVVVDLSTRTDEELNALQAIYLGRFLLALKHSRDSAYIASYWRKFVIFASRDGNKSGYMEFVIATVLYLSATSNMFNEKMRDMDNLITAEEREIFKPYFLELYEKGMEKGMEKPIRVFLLKNPEWTNQQVAELFEVSVTVIQKIREMSGE